MFLHRHLPDLCIEVVELDSGVLEVACEFCGFAEDARLRVFVEDGRDFIERRDRLYDAIVLDCFSAEAIPPHLLTLEFLQEVRRSLNPGGMAVANIWGRADNRLYEHMLLTYRAAFEEVYVLDVPGIGTRVFVALTLPNRRTREEILMRLTRLAPSFGGETAPARWRHSDLEPLQTGTVLRD
jgi:spermidine synthase